MKKSNKNWGDLPGECKCDNLFGTNDLPLDQIEKEVGRRIAIIWKIVRKVSYILKGNYPNSLKSQIFNNCVVPA